MLIINLSPIRANHEQLIINYVSPIITINDTSYDLSLIPDGATVDHIKIKNCFFC